MLTFDLLVAMMHCVDLLTCDCMNLDPTVLPNSIDLMTQMSWVIQRMSSLRSLIPFRLSHLLETSAHA